MLITINTDSRGEFIVKRNI